MLVSVPLSSVGSLMEGLNVFATVSHLSVSWKNFPPCDNHLFKASYAPHLLGIGNLAQPGRPRGFVLPPGSLWQPIILKSEVMLIPLFFSPLSFSDEVTSPSLVDESG